MKKNQNLRAIIALLAMVIGLTAVAASAAASDSSQPDKSSAYKCGISCGDEMSESYAASCKLEDTSKHCGHCGMGGSEEEHEHSSADSGDKPSCHNHDAEAEGDTCTHAHSIACVEYYQGNINSMVSEVCGHGDDPDHEHDSTCMTAFAESHGHYCTDECRPHCTTMANLLLEGCHHVHTAECEISGCHLSAEEAECVDGFIGTIEMMMEGMEQSSGDV
ncbi:MAG TPA: hypothetical protein VGB30_06295 [bacterium]